MGVENKLRELVMTTLGEATMCWNPQPSIQVFDNKRATRIGEELITKILNLYATKEKN